MRLTPRPRTELGPFVALLLFSSTLLYLVALPRSTGQIDEAVYLNEVLRIYRGEVMYRDFFDPTAPGWMHLMAALFHIFGATFAVARITAAVIQAATALIVFIVCRELRVRRALAFAAAVLCVTSAQASFPIASQHWLATLLSMLVLLIYLRYGHSRAGVCATGIGVGLFIAVHQQRGLTVGLGAGAFLLVDAWAAWRRDRTAAITTVARRAAAFAGGVAAIVIPMLFVLVWRAGFQPVWQALVVFPLVDYRHNVHWAWGDGARGWPASLMKYLPAALGLTLIRLLSPWQQRPDGPDPRAIVIVALHCLASLLSIWYLPDRIHIAFILPGFVTLIAEHLECILERMRGRWAGPLGWIAALAVAAPCVLWLGSTYTTLWIRHPYSYRGPFGRIDVSDAASVQLYTKVDTLLQDVPSRTLYCHLLSAYTCLLSRARNPTRFEALLNHYSNPEQIREALEALNEQHVPYVVAPPAVVRNDDPIGAFILRHYEQRPDTNPVARYVWHRKTAQRPAASEYW